MELTAVITGASGGIGQAMVRMFAAAGYRVFCGCFSHPESLEAFDGAAMLPGLSGGGLPGGFVLALAGRRLCQRSFGPYAVDMSTCWSTMRA